MHYKDGYSLCLSHIQPRAPYDFYHPYDFLPVRPNEAPVGNLRRCCSRGHIRLRARTIWHDCTLMVWSNDSQDSMGTPCGARTGIVRALHGNLQCSSYPTGPVRGPCGTHKGAVRQPYGHVRKLTQRELSKLPHGHRIWPYGARMQTPQGLFTGSLQYLNPYGARKLIMHALKLYGPRTGRQNSYGAALGPCVDVRFLFKTAREQPVRGPGVLCDWGIRQGALLFFKVHHQISRSYRLKISDLNQVWVRFLGWSQLPNLSDLPCLFSCKMIKQNQLENHLVLLYNFCEAPFLLVKHTVTWISWNWPSYCCWFHCKDTESKKQQSLTYMENLW